MVDGWGVLGISLGANGPPTGIIAKSFRINHLAGGPLLGGPRGVFGSNGDFPNVSGVLSSPLEAG